MNMTNFTFGEARRHTANGVGVTKALIEPHISWGGRSVQNDGFAWRTCLVSLMLVGCPGLAKSNQAPSSDVQLTIASQIRKDQPLVGSPTLSYLLYGKGATIFRAERWVRDGRPRGAWSWTPILLREEIPGNAILNE